VPAGSVAIGGAQTGVYPLASPGGWRLIGRTPIRLFQPEAFPPTLLEMGDTVRFVRIDRQEFERLAAAASPGGALPGAGGR
jgi:inhibitor of KinA